MKALILHRGFGNKETIFISGHVFEKYANDHISKKSSVIKNIFNNLRRYLNKPAANIEVDIVVNGQKFHATTNNTGFFMAEIPIALDNNWHPYEVEVRAYQIKQSSQFKICSELGLGVISDIDDTLLVSHSNIDIRKLYTYLSKNIYTRKPTKQFTGLFQQIDAQHKEQTIEDFFYVSNSEWNLYEFLMAFFDLHEMPKGTYFLNNLISHPIQFFQSQGKSEVKGHKYSAIKRIISLFDRKKFILIGDTAQHDVTLFENIISDFPDRIDSVYLRRIKTKHVTKYQKLQSLSISNEINFSIV